MGALMTKPTKEQIQKFYSDALERCLEAFARLDEKEWNKKASDQGTAKDHLASLVGTFENETLPETRQVMAGQPVRLEGFESRADTLRFRQESARKVKDLPPAQLLDRLRAAVGEHLAMLETLGEADLDRPMQSPAWDRPGTLRDVFFASYLFLASQYQEIRRVNKKKIPHWVEASPPEHVQYHMSRIFHYMPLIFRSDRAQDMEATYLFNMEGAGQWSIRIANGKAESVDGAPEQYDIELKTKPELWLDLSTGELNPVFAIATRKVHLGGNPALAMKLAPLFSVE